MTAKNLTSIFMGIVLVTVTGASEPPSWTAEVTGREDRPDGTNLWTANLVHERTIAPDPASFAFREARVNITWAKYTAHVQWSEEPDLVVTGQQLYDGSPESSLHGRARFANSTFDLGVGYPWRPTDSWTIVPWIGASRMEQLFQLDNQIYEDVGDLVRKEDHRWDYTGLGAGIGVDVKASWSWIVFQTRAVTRWTTGTMRTESTTEYFPTESEDMSTSSGRTSGSMWSFDAGIGVETSGLTATVGWSVRDLSTDFGPGRIQGPYVRLSARY